MAYDMPEPLANGQTCTVARIGDTFCGKPAVAMVGVCGDPKPGGKIPIVERGACLEHLKNYRPQPKRCPVCSRQLWTRNVPWGLWWEWFCPNDVAHFSEKFWPKEKSLRDFEPRCASMHLACQADGLPACPICHKKLIDENGRVSLADETRAMLALSLESLREYSRELDAKVAELMAAIAELEPTQ